jgi:hypothetical protein
MVTTILALVWRLCRYTEGLEEDECNQLGKWEPLVERTKLKPDASFTFDVPNGQVIRCVHMHAHTHTLTHTHTRTRVRARSCARMHKNGVCVQVTAYLTHTRPTSRPQWNKWRLLYWISVRI